MDRRRQRSALLLVVVLVAACTSDPSPETTALSPLPSSTPLPVPSGTVPSVSAEDGGVYLALGDSVTFGVGVASPRQNGYPARVVDALASAMPPISASRVFAVPGETAGGFRDRRLDDVVRAIEELGPRVELVTVGLGANEILRARRDAACVADRASDGCRTVVDRAADEAAIALDAVVSTIQSTLEANGSDAPLFLLAYYNPDTDPLAVESVVGSDGAVGCDRDEQRAGLNDRIACVATARSTGLVDLYAAFLGREDELTRVAAGDVHPNAAGYAVIAEAIVAAANDRSP